MRTKVKRFLVATASAVALVLPFLACSAQATPETAARVAADPVAPMALKVLGNRFINQRNATIQLRGVNFSGTQYACAEGWGVFDAPATDASITALKSWKVNAVRLPLNESCWLGINGVKAAYGGANYRNAVNAWVTKLTAASIYVIVDMHWNAAGTAKALDQKAAADRDHANTYWSSVANVFKGNPAVVFDLYNEPYPDRNRDTTAAWKCTRDGGTCPGVGFQVAGSQEMLNAVRATGSTNVVLVSGPEYAGSVRRWAEFKPADPLNQIAASVHIYGQPLGSPYDDPSRWGEVNPTTIGAPIVVGEYGDSDCTHQFTDRLLPVLDTRLVSYMAWGWVVSDCAGEPSLLKDYKGTPSAWGVGVKAHYTR